jgi:hypothetical protein
MREEVEIIDSSKSLNMRKKLAKNSNLSPLSRSSSLIPYLILTGLGWAGSFPSKIIHFPQR